MIESPSKRGFIPISAFGQSIHYSIRTNPTLRLGPKSQIVVMGDACLARESNRLFTNYTVPSIFFICFIHGLPDVVFPVFAGRPFTEIWFFFRRRYQFVVE